MDKMMLAVVVVASAFCIPHVQSRNCSLCTDPSCFTQDMIGGRWLGTDGSEITRLTSCYDVTLTPCGDDSYNLVGWYYVMKPAFDNVTFELPNMHPLLPASNLYWTIGTVHPNSFFGIPFPELLNNIPFIFVVQFLQGDACSFLNIRLLAALPNIFVTNTLLVLVRDIEDQAARQKGLEFMKTHNGDPSMHQIYDECCGF